MANNDGKVLVYSKYITLRNGKRIYAKTVFRFWAKPKK